MGLQLGDFVVGFMVLVLGILGLFVAAGALDIEMTIFGWSLVAFSVLFNLGLVKGHFDRQEAVRAEARDHV